jgi:hypothetical protein
MDSALMFWQVILGSSGFVKLSFRKHDARLGFVSIKDMPTMYFIPDQLAFIPGRDTSQEPGCVFTTPRFLRNL